jgi:hypothetical protein
MINLILQEAKKYLGSEQYAKELNLLANTFLLNEDDLGYLAMITNDVISGAVAEESFLKELRNVSNIKKDVAEKLDKEVKERIFKPFKNRIERMLKEDSNLNNPINVEPQKITTLRTLSSAPQQPQPHPSQPLTKASILAEIENPPRTVVKRYVIEHEPIKDPGHLIDDTIDQRKKLEDHYND